MERGEGRENVLLYDAILMGRGSSLLLGTTISQAASYSNLAAAYECRMRQIPLKAAGKNDRAHVVGFGANGCAAFLAGTF